MDPLVLVSSSQEIVFLLEAKFGENRYERNSLWFVSFIICLKMFEKHLWKWHQACNFIKRETLDQAFSCEFCKISKNIFFHRTPVVAAQGRSSK